MAPKSRTPLPVDGPVVADPELAGILDRVGQRRRRRSSSELTQLRRPLGRLDGAPVRAGRAPSAAPVDAPVDAAIGAPTDAPVDVPAGRTEAEIVAPTRAARAPGRSTASGPAGAVLSVDDVGPTVRILRIGRPADFTYVAGQHLKIGTAGTRRGTYSIASSPFDAHVEICVKLVPDGRLTPGLFQVRPGAELVSDWRAKGSFRLDERARTHVLVATAAGISPLRSLLRDARRKGMNGPVVVLHGASHPDELPYLDELTALAASDPNLRYQATVSRGAAPRSRAWSGPTGRVDVLAASVLAGVDPGNTRVYACGNGGMVKAVAALASKLGFPVSTESFG